MIQSETNVDYDVAIVGAGPVGALLANLLGCGGRRVLLIDKEREIYALPRAVHFDGEVMRAFQSIGLADEIAAISRASSKGMHFISSTGQTLLIRRGFDGVGPQGWANNYYVHRPDLEAVLRKALARHQSVVARYGVEVTAIKETADAVAVGLTCAERQPETLTANYLIGCDGARSFVRDRLHPRGSRPASAVARGRCAHEADDAAGKEPARIHGPTLRSEPSHDPCLRRWQPQAVGDHADTR